MEVNGTLPSPLSKTSLATLWRDVEVGGGGAMTSY